MIIKLLGSFVEGDKIKFLVRNGGVDKWYTRIVKWDNQAKDLCFVYKNCKYYFYEFYSDAPVLLNAVSY